LGAPGLKTPRSWVAALAVASPDPSPAQRFFFERFFAQKRLKNKLRENLAIYWMKSLAEIAQLLSISRWYRSILDESTHTWMNKCTFIYNLDEGGSYTPVKIAFCTT
jgi:hypothetical protein